MSIRQFIANERIVPFNPKMIEGLAGSTLNGLVDYLDTIFKNSQKQKNYPMGLSYEGMSMASPEEYYDEFIKLKYGRARSVKTDKSNNGAAVGKGYDVSEYDYYAVKLQMALNGELLKPRILFIPYTTHGGLMKLRGSTYSISMLLADVATSVKNYNIFLIFNNGKIIAKRFSHNLRVNGEVLSVPIVHTRAWQKGSGKNKVYPNNSNTSLAHYLFASHGFNNAMEVFGKCTVAIGYDDINYDNYPMDEWDIVTTARESGKPNLYEASIIRLAVRKEDRSILVDQLIASFFYVVDLFPDRIDPQYIDDPYIWKLMMGKIICDHTGEGKLVGAIETHLRSVESYVCRETIQNYHDDGIHIESWDSLIVYLMENYHVLVTRGDEVSMYGKRLKLNRYIGGPIIHKYNTMIFALGKAASKEPLTAKVVESALSSISTTAMFNTKLNAEINPYGSPSDNTIFMKMQMILQDDSTKGGHRTSKTDDPKKLIDVSLADAGRYCAQKKSEPTGRGLNPCVRLSEDMNILQREELADMLNTTDRLLKM